MAAGTGGPSFPKPQSDTSTLAACHMNWSPGRVGAYDHGSRVCLGPPGTGPGGGSRHVVCIIQACAPWHLRAQLGACRLPGGHPHCSPGLTPLASLPRKAQPSSHLPELGLCGSLLPGIWSGTGWPSSACSQASSPGAWPAGEAQTEEAVQRAECSGEAQGKVPCSPVRPFSVP